MLLRNGYRTVYLTIVRSKQWLFCRYLVPTYLCRMKSRTKSEQAWSVLFSPLVCFSSSRHRFRALARGPRCPTSGVPPSVHFLWRRTDSIRARARRLCERLWRHARARTHARITQVCSVIVAVAAAVDDLLVITRSNRTQLCLPTPQSISQGTRRTRNPPLPPPPPILRAANGFVIGT